MNRWLYPGTFDPPTLGHLDLISRALPLCDELLIAVADNREKNTLLPLADRLRLMSLMTKGIERVQVISFDTLLTDLVGDRGVNAVLRGVRAFSDFEYELAMALINRKMLDEFETIFMMPSEKYMSLSSSLVKEIMKYGGDVSQFVTPDVFRELVAAGIIKDEENR
jgi:pantetheine-phosphate adenylyltransferase